MILSLALALAVSMPGKAQRPTRMNGTIDWIFWAPGATILFNARWLQSIRGDGSGLQRMSMRGWRGSWSPDLHAIAVNRSDGIGVIHLDGRGMQPLTREGNSPVWSPSGDRIAYSYFGDIRVVRADGSGDHLAVPLRFGENFDREFGWSSDGRQMVFSACLRRVPDGEECPDAVYTAELAHPRIRHRISPGRGTCPDWGRTGAIAYRAGHGVAIARPRTRPRIVLARAFSCPTWSPDGRSLAVDGARKLVVISVDGVSRRSLGSFPPLPTCCASPAPPGPVWSPDGRFVAVVRTVQNRQSQVSYLLYVLRVRNGRANLIVQTPFGD